MKKYILLLSILSCSSPSGFIIEGSIELQNENDWVYLRLYDERYNLIEDALVKLGIKTIPYDEEKYAYFRDSIGISFGYPYKLTVSTEEHTCTLSAIIPPAFEANFPSSGVVGSSCSITWESEGIPDEWRVVIFHGDIVVFEEILGGYEDSVWVPGSSFYESGDYTIHVYAINYGEARGDVIKFIFAGIVSKKREIKVSK